jgi:DNA-binding HxlR family transcriptional regulator
MPADHSPAACSRISAVLSRVGDRWSTLIIYRLSHGTTRFNALKRELGISQRMLSLSLRDLERDGLILRTAFPTVPPRVEYELTDLGRSLQEPIRLIGEWALQNLDVIDAARARFDAAEGASQIAAQ